MLTSKRIRRHLLLASALPDDRGGDAIRELVNEVKFRGAQLMFFFGKAKHVAQATTYEDAMSRAKRLCTAIDLVME